MENKLFRKALFLTLTGVFIIVVSMAMGRGVFGSDDIMVIGSVPLFFCGIAFSIFGWMKIPKEYR